MPTTREVVRAYSEPFYDVAQCYYQAAPYLNPLPYHRNITKTTYWGNLTSSATMGQARIEEQLNSETAKRLRAIAGESFYENARSSTALAETLAELSGSFMSIAQGTDRVLRSYGALKKGRVGKAFHILGSKRPTFRGRLADNVANVNLSWQFAVKPTIQSISDSVNFLQGRPPLTPIRSSASGNWLNDRCSGTCDGTGYGSLFQQSYAFRVHVGAMVKVVNPNLALADSYGFMNPAKLGWELLPGSFLVDYFVPIGKFLGAFSPLFGRELSQEYVTTVIKGSYSRTAIHKYDGITGNYTHDSVLVDRNVDGIRQTYRPTDVLRLKLPHKGAADTTVSLAVKTFRGKW